MPERTSKSAEAKRVGEILAAAKALAADYYQLTGKPLGVTGEVAEYVAAHTLHLKLAPPRTAGHDATRLKKGRVECLQIKGRAFQPRIYNHRKKHYCGSVRPCAIGTWRE
jgi:hypothetical protein